MKRVVIAEGEPFLARMLRTALVRMGYRVQTATDGESAWELLRGDPPDALITAANLAGLSGLDLCRRLRSDMSQRDLPTIIMTGRSDDDVRRAAAQFNRAVVLDKPVSIRKILDQLDNFFAGDSMVDTLVGEDRIR